MTRGLALLAALLGACADAHSGEPINACRVASAMRQEALNRALADQPACVQDSDCVEMSAPVHCDRVVDLGDCGYVVHRSARERYDAKAVTDSICRAVQGAQLGCSLGPSCTAHGPPVCRAGMCEAAPL